MVSFGERVQELRKCKGLTQKQMAEFLNMTESGFRRYENNRSTPHYETLARLADFFNCSVDYLMCRTDMKEICRNDKEAE